MPASERPDRPDSLHQEHWRGSHLLVDNTGIKAAGEGEWSTRKHEASQPRQWRKVHLEIDANTMEVGAIEITGSRVGDDQMPPELLAQIPANEAIGLVTADGAYDTWPCYAAIAARQASAMILTRRNGRCWKEATPSAQARNEILRATKRLGRTISRSWSGYHRRSRVGGQDALPEALGERLMARTFDRQTTEFHIRATILSRFTRLGTPETQRVA